MIPALTGLLAGTLHVWSGPDHLAAIAPIAVQGRGRSWMAGLRWGVGHSAGVGVVAALSLALRDVLPLDRVSGIGERLVGVLLVGIGLWGLRSALRTRVHVHQHAHDGTPHSHIHVHATPAGHERPAAHVHLHAALGIGILHGVAGSSHFLGVLPALAFPSTADAVAYLIAYAAGTIGSMAAFALGVGRLADRAAVDGTRLYRGLMAACSAAAVVVGLAWLRQP